MAYVKDATVADAPGIAAVWRAGLFAAYPGIIAADIIERCPPVKDYLKQIGKVPLLSAEQEVDLAKRIEAGPRITCLRPTCEVQKYGREPISLHTPLGEDGDSEFGDLIEDSDPRDGACQAQRACREGPAVKSRRDGVSVRGAAP